MMKMLSVAGRSLLAGLALAAVTALPGCGKPAGVALADGGTARFEQWRGQTLLINYWAEWCAPCRSEIPELNHLHEKHAGRAQSGAVVLGVNYDGLTGEKLAALVAEMDIRFPVLVEDPRQRWSQPLPEVLPSTLIIGPDGELQEVLVGPQTYEMLAEAIGLEDDVDQR